MRKKKPAWEDPYRYKDFRRAFDALNRSFTQGNHYALLLGESGAGKTTLLRALAAELDKSRFQLLYLCHGRPSPSALARVLAEALHLPMQRTRAETSRLLMQNLKALPIRLLLWIDESQLISEDTLHEIRLLAEADLQGPPLFSVVLAALPELKERLLAPGLFPLWRRITVKAELTGLTRDEVVPFLVHTLGPRTPKAFSEEALNTLFERSRAIPALLLDQARQCLQRRPDTKQVITADQVAERLS